MKFYFFYPNGDESAPHDSYLEAYDQYQRAVEGRCGWFPFNWVKK